MSVNIAKFRPIVCPGCKSTDKWRVALGSERIIIDCTGNAGVDTFVLCTYRLSLPTDESLWTTDAMFKMMPMEYDESVKVQN